jgi:hypothetical protein
MSQTQTLAQLQQLAKLMLDHRLGALQAAAAQREETLRKIESLRGQGGAHLEEDGIGLAIAALNYQRWAEARRYDLRQNLARQTAQWLDARDAAMHAFGKNRALDGLRDKISHRPKDP